MDALALIFGLLAGPVLLSAFGALTGSDLYDIDVNTMASLWDREHVSPPDPATIRHAELKQRLEVLAREQAQSARVSLAGTSAEGREIYLVSFGTGPDKILLWSQMHGDEPTATSSLLDLFHFLGRHREDAWVREMLAKYTLLAIPMLNPDGAERGQRRNAQGIDVNRDARALQTPEGRILKHVRDTHAPFLGFNLHNQNSLTTVGDTGRVATIALLAVGADAPGAPGAVLSKQITAVIYEALAPFAYGHVSRYDESYNPRAFGDNLALWGTPVVLIESGGAPAGQPSGFTVKLNFIALLAALNSLSTGRIQNANPAVFDALESNSDTPIFDLMLRNAWVFAGTGLPLFRADVAIRGDARAEAKGEAIIAELGDLGVFSAHRTIDCTGMLLTPGLIAWEPDREPLSGDPGAGLLQRGITTVLETVPGTQLAAKSPAPDLWRSTARAVNWAFLVSGAPSGAGADWELLLSDWLAAGGRGWVPGANPANPSRALRIPRWFGVEAWTRQEADAFRPPAVLCGDPVKSLPRWTSEAARRFRIPRRGIIAPGAIADIVLWRTRGGNTPPADVKDCMPVQVILGGQVIDLPQAAESSHGRFLK